MAYSTTELFGTASQGISQRTYTRVWRVVSDDVINHPTQVISQAPVFVGALFPYDLDAFAKTITANYENAEESRKVALVVATYETGSGGEEEENEDPLQDRPDIRWGSRTVRLPVKFTNDNPQQAITNSAGEDFDPLPEEDFQILVYEYSHNIANYSEAQASGYRGAINSDSFTLAGLSLGPYEARIQSISAQNAERNGIRYWRESVTVEIVDDWRLTLVDEGLRKKSAAAAGDGPGAEVYLGDGNFGKVEPILDAFGNPVFEKVLLDGNGGVLQGGNPVLLRFNTAAKPLRAFGPLGLPTTNNP
ncbi:MAG: hypothetical protein EBY40_00220 [Marivivens sp.]|nr:hypothetical protein [Marivivens sp.]NBT50019.1 hypothetical protein [Marivivens sp.]NCW67033.1 hypothetical protein [Marivivens sp.]NDH01534.1 hypothetical protein [Marivivens sp.]